MRRNAQDFSSGEALRQHLRDTGWLPQAPDLPGSWKLRKYLEYAAWLKEVPRGERANRVGDALRAVDLHSRSSDRIRTLSGGMQRRLGLAQAIVANPDFLVLDEPTAGLDPDQRTNFYELMRGLAKNRTVLLSTHLLEDVSELCDRVVVLQGGVVVFAGQVLEFLSAGGDRNTSLSASFSRIVGDAKCV